MTIPDEHDLEEKCTTCGHAYYLHMPNPYEPKGICKIDECSCTSFNPAQQTHAEAPHGCVHANKLPSEPHGYLYCADCGLRW